MLPFYFKQNKINLKDLLKLKKEKKMIKCYSASIHGVMV